MNLSLLCYFPNSEASSHVLDILSVRNTVLSATQIRWKQEDKTNRIRSRIYNEKEDNENEGKVEEWKR